MGKTDRTETDEPGAAIMALESAALERWGKGDPSGFLEISAPDVVYFDPGLTKRIDGWDALSRYYETLRGKVFFDRFELLNPLVQVVGDAAVLTFNYVSYAKNDGSQISPNSAQLSFSGCVTHLVS